jgi:C_GCAxxG_C_C family probable redox protein
MPDPVKTALEHFQQGYSCAQAIFSAFSPMYGLSEELALKIASPFGGGIARLGETCGAVTGAIMVIGLKYGQADRSDPVENQPVYHLCRVLIERFREHNETIRCYELIGIHLDDPDELRMARENGVFKDHCRGYVQTAAEILLEILSSTDQATSVT